MWEHERLKVYPKALAIATNLRAIAADLPDGEGDLRDQLRRAGHSVVLNIAEGASEYSIGDKARFYRMARRSCAECSSALDILLCDGPTHPRVPATRALLNEVAAMLTALIKHRPARPEE